MALSLVAKLMKSLKMRHSLTIATLAVLLLFQNHICLGSRIDKNHDTAEDNLSIPDDDFDDDDYHNDFDSNDDDDSSEMGITPRDHPRIKRNVYPEDFSVGRGGLQDSPTHENLKSGETLSDSESRASATGISVADGWALGYGKASVSGGNRGYVNGRDGQAYNPGVETAEEFGMKSGKDIAIARVGSGGRAGEGASLAGGGSPGINYPVDERGGTYDSGYGNERGPARPMAGSVDERGTGFGDERTPIRPVDERVPYDRGFDGNKGIPTRPVTGVADGAGPYDRGYGKGRGPSKPLTGQRGTDRRVVDDGYPGIDMTGVRIPPTIDNNGRTIYSYNTDGRPTRVTFTDRNGGKGVVNHFFERKNLDNGLSGDRKVTGTSFRSGFSLAYGGGNGGGGGAVAYGGGNSGAVAYGNGIKIPGRGVANGDGLGNGPAAAYGSDFGDGRSVAYASGSGIVSGTGISIGDTYAGSRNSRKPNSGVRSTGFSLRQGTGMGNGRGYSKAVIYA